MLQSLRSNPLSTVRALPGMAGMDAIYLLHAIMHVKTIGVMPALTWS